MANIGDKYIIEVEALGIMENDTYYLKNSVLDHSVVSGRALQGFEKYDPEADYQRGLNEAWEAAQKIFCYEEDGGMGIDGCKKAFGTAVFGKIAALPFEKVMSTLAAYEAEKKAEEDIKVGDEVYGKYLGYHTKIIVVRKSSNGRFFSGVDGEGCTYANRPIGGYVKTGRHFPQVVELLNAMKEGG